MHISEATRRYERWLGTFMPLHAPALARKHGEMTGDPFRFMRATCYRFCQQWRTLGEEGEHEHDHAFPVLGVGDLHIENFGTWRDSDGRLIWGINDFDEAAYVPWPSDLVRLMASALVAIEGRHLTLRPRAAARALWAGYEAGIETGWRPFVLEEQNGWLRRTATGRLRSPVAFWRRLGEIRPTRVVPPEAVRILEARMPGPGLGPLRIGRRTSGLGSLGRPRFVGIADWHGGLVAREVKALAPSAWTWAASVDGGGDEKRVERTIHYRKILDTAVRAPDPMLGVVGRWVTRRLAPHCTRVELTELPDDREELRLLAAMGFETANVHLGTPGARRAIAREIPTIGSRALARLGKRFARATIDDWRAWRADRR